RREEVDVAALRHRRVEVAVEQRLLLGIGERPLVEIGLLVREVPLAVLLLHEGHTELVEVVALRGLFGIEDRCPRNLLIGLVECHDLLQSCWYYSSYVRGGEASSGQ